MDESRKVCIVLVCLTKVVFVSVLAITIVLNWCTC